VTPGGRLPRPRRPGAPVLGTIVAVGVWGVVAHDSGVGWVQAVGALVAGFLLVGLVGPALAVARARCAVVSVPADAVAGGPATVEISVSTALELRPVDPPGPPALSGASARCAVELRPQRRGMLDQCTVVIASAAPFGLMWWTRTVVLVLPRPLAVAPRIGAPDTGLRSPAAGGEVGVRPAPGRGSELRGVRPYERGDRRHLVHWPATAHTGALMVREVERAAGGSVTVRGVLPDDPDAAEDVAQRVMGTVAELLRTGERIELVTAEPGGRVRAPVSSLADAGRRLARALPRPRGHPSTREDGR
jgi:uncharacterized protein (DUF58 family)